MLELAVIKIQGTPVAKSRPRFRIMKHFVQTYIPKKAALEMKRIREEIKEQFKQEPFDFPLFVSLRFVFDIPKSFTKKQRQAVVDNYYYHTKKPDCDNLAKLVLDAMNGVVYKDDKQVFGLEMVKLYAKEGVTAHTEIVISRGH